MKRRGVLLQFQLRVDRRFRMLAARRSTRPSNLRATMVASTAIILSGIFLTELVLPNGEAGVIFKVAAIGVGLSLSVAVGIEATVGLYNVIRVDILMLLSLYGLTFVEFLFPQPDLSSVVSAAI